ncbi:hypothetical protein [Niastella sp. OAS944]|uniref:hypothetical protein n=1 Tax=Niastella sp. OAS944 TaxID=2664089 RepID=UPI00346D3AC4|nr:hypothetical protein [Chitinophagaceae bacterium OAS944]
MKLIIFASILLLFSCKKNDATVKEEQVLLVVVKDYRPTSNGNLYWGINITFSSAVTLNGSVNVEYDIYSQSLLYKHYSYKVQFFLNNQSSYIYNTFESAQLTGAEIKNIKVSGLTTDGNYNISIMEPTGTVSGGSSSSGGSGSSGGCGTHNGKQLYKGSDGGCYYINSNGNKTYVDRNECHC